MTCVIPGDDTAGHFIRAFIKVEAVSYCTSEADEERDCNMPVSVPNASLKT